MAEVCERPERVMVEIGRLPGRFVFERARGRVYRAPRPFRFVAELPDECEPGLDYVVAGRFPVEVDALRAYFTEDAAAPDLVQAFNPPLLLAEGDVLEPTVPADLPGPCRGSPG